MLESILSHVRHRTLRSVMTSTVIAACGFFGANTQTMAQNVSKIDPASTDPLTLKARGSFFVGGETVEQTFVELGSRRPADRVTINQMYVEYMVPAAKQKTPVVMIHGAGLSGQSYDTTPDGRMGWFEYFVRKNHSVYVVDQIGRARSGFNQAIFNNVGAGLAKSGDQPKIVRMADRFAAWVNFRFGPEPGVPFPDTLFPVDAAGELSRQGIPDLDSTLPSPNPNYRALSLLASKVGGAVLIGHSQSGAYPLEAALLAPDAVKAAVLVEPGSCGATTYTDQQIATLAKIPVLVVYGDHLSAPTFVPGPGWQDRFNGCEQLISRLRRANGKAEMLHPPKLGIRGNSHMIMQDKNNRQIADMIIDWIDRHD